MKIRNRLALLSSLSLLSFSATSGAEFKDGLNKAVSSLEEGLSHLRLEAREIIPWFDGYATVGTYTPGTSLANDNLHNVVFRFADLENRLASFNTPEQYLHWSLEFLGLFCPRQSHLKMPGGLKAAADSLDTLFPGAGQSLVELVEADRLIREAYRKLTSAEIEELKKYVKNFPFWLDQWPANPVERMITLSRRVDLACLWASALTAAGASARLQELVKKNTQVWVNQESTREKFILNLDTPWGAVIVGGRQENDYRQKCLLILDLGGDDSYEIPPSGWPLVSMIIDLEGNDSYKAEEGYALGGALFGLSWLEDHEGNDTYKGASFSLGAAALGVGVLIDFEGEDNYRGGPLSQGMSFFGLGMLADFEGDDSYEVSFGGQAACFAGGAGLLIDLNGDDRYTAGGHYPDWRTPGATKSFAQGSAAGLRPFGLGGTALLYDRAGADNYEIDYFGQGAGYWGGCGLLVDSRGDDSYKAGRYAQGCGLHTAFGLLADGSGSDCYTLGGVGQGMGEDRAYGVFLEGQGADSYRAGWMARGAGGTGGVGLLLEIHGNDNYQEAAKAADGYGSRAWELSGLGFLIDCVGDDIYGNRRIQGQIIRSGTWGAMVDLPFNR